MVVFIIMNIILHFGWPGFKSDTILYANSHVSFIFVTHKLANLFCQYTLAHFLLHDTGNIWARYKSTHLGLNT